MAGSIKGIIVEIGGDTSGLQNALKKVNSATSSLSKELRGINSLLKLDPKNTELLAQKQDVLNKQIQTTQDKLKSLKEVQERAVESQANGVKISEENWRNLQREIINTENKLKQLQLETSKWNLKGKDIEEFGKKIEGLGEKASNVGSKLTKSLTLPVTAGLALATKNAIEFESAFTGVEKTVDGTEEQMQKLRQGIKDLSKEIPSTTTEISAVAEAAGQLGIQTDSVLSFTRTMIDLGNATNLSADEAATTLARFANITRMSQKDFDKLGSVIVALGNNFATTEAEIANMGMNLASAGTQVGMSQSQILALATALSSVGLEAQAGGTAFSKVMINMQLAVEKGGSSLKDFAKVAGMSTKEFQKAFKEDASSAIMSFVNGLSKAGERGKSAIKILDDMGITETRLRDALLRSANASEIMNNAVELGNKAWEENSALTEEANKRYSTTESQLKILNNKMKSLVSSLGEKLLPTINKLLDKAGDWIKRLDKLSDKEKENIVNIGLMVAAAGPLLKIIGKFGTATGTVVKGVGKVSQAIAVLKTGAASSSTSVNTLAKVLSTLTTPTGALVAVFATLTAAFGAYVLAVTAKTRELIGETNKQQKAWEDLGNSRNEMLSNSMTEISYLEKLKSELANITDENGKVKDGYEKRAEVILNELNKALETEYKLNGNIIQNYKDIDSALDEVIRKKKVEATLTAYQEEYQRAIKEQADATEKLVELQNKQADAQERMNASNPIKASVAKQEYEALTKEIGEQAKMISEYGKTITDYEELQKASISGSAEEMEKAVQRITTSYDKQRMNIDKSVTEQIQIQKTGIKRLEETYRQAKESNNTYLAEILEKQIAGHKEQLVELERSLIEQTKKVEELTPEQIEAWKNLSQDDFNVYLEGLSQLPEGTRKKIEEATGIVTSNTSLGNATLKLGDGASSTFLGSFKLQEGANKEVSATSQQLSGDNQVKIATGKIAQEATKEFKNNTDGKKWGNDLISNLVTGLTSTRSLGAVGNAASGIAGIIKKYIGHSVPAAGPLKDEMSYMPDMIDNLVKTLDKASPELNNKTIELAKMMSNNLNIEASQGKLNQEIVSQSKNIFTTPQIVFNVQELDREKLDQCFNYVNMKFGSAY